jgi:hypothetical protein
MLAGVIEVVLKDGSFIGRVRRKGEELTPEFLEELKREAVQKGVPPEMLAEAEITAWICRTCWKEGTMSSISAAAQP